VRVGRRLSFALMEAHALKGAIYLKFMSGYFTHVESASDNKWFNFCFSVYLNAYPSAGSAFFLWF
jgi:hypothetical protein